MTTTANPSSMAWQGASWSAVLAAAWRGDTPPQVDAVHTDTRTLTPGSLFVALKGVRFDAHDYLEDAMNLGATAAVVAQCPQVDAFHQKFPRFCLAVVDDTLMALGDLAAAWKAISKAKTVAITGSCGKTSTKDMLTGILARQADTWATRGNLNNRVGVPLTLLGLRDQHFLVVEAGMSEPGEITTLARIINADVAVVTTVQKAHLEGMGGLQQVAWEKTALFRHAADQGRVLVANADDPLVIAGARACRGQSSLLTYGLDGAGLDVTARQVELLSAGSRFLLEARGAVAQVSLPVPGRHMVSNALAAAAAAAALGVDIADMALGLSEARLTPGRLTLRSQYEGILVYDDSYNANPASMSSALRVLAAHKGRRIAVLGSMLELGPEAAQLHREVGQEAAQSAELVLCYGPNGQDLAAGVASANGSAEVYDDMDTLVKRLKAVAGQGDAVLVKGSRGMAMERSLAALERFRNGSNPEVR